MSFTLHGLGVSKGIAIGPVHILRPQLEITESTVSEELIPVEIARFKAALEQTSRDLLRIRDQIPLIYPIRDSMPGNTAAEIASFIDPHILMLEDSMLAQVPIELMRSQRCNAEWALKLQRDRLVGVFEAIDDPYLQARKNDVDQVISRLQACLAKQAQPDQHLDDNPVLLAGSIVLADDLTPADTALMPHQGIRGFITEHGGTNSHTAIVARSLGIPAIVGVRHARRYIRSDDILVIDGHRNVILVNPDHRSLRFYRVLQNEKRLFRNSLNRLKEAPAITRDGYTISLQANIEFPADMSAVKRAGAEGIGLYRTEFLYMHREQQPPPDEEEHYRAYTRIIRSVNGPVTIRTLDLGADKQVEGITHKKGGPNVINPALGLRAVRLCLKDLRLFKPQLRAILRASALGPVRVMIPMISGLQEFFQVQTLINDIKQELQHEGLPFDPDLPIGAMVEIPSVAICTDLFMPYVDFLSIGTNDLIQYTLAIDRGDDEVSYLYNPLHPAVLRLLKLIISTADKAGKPVSMCGEMAGESRYVRLLLGMGLRHFSVNSESLLEVKQIIRHSEVRKLTPLADQVLHAVNGHEIDALMKQINAH